MTINFPNGQYFDPMYGWRDVKSEPKMPETSLPTKAIDESMAYVIDEQMQKIIDRYKADSEARREMEKNQAQQPEISKTEYEVFQAPQKYSLYTTGNKMTVSVSIKPSYFLATYLSNYEGHRNSILDLKDKGYCDEAIDMLLAELDNQFASNTCRGLSEQLQGLGYSKDNAERTARMFNEEYLKTRGNTGTTAGDARKVLENLGLSNVDIYFGRPDHYGTVPGFAPGTSLEGYFRGMALFDDFYDKMYNSMPEPITLQTPGNMKWERSTREPAEMSLGEAMLID